MLSPLPLRAPILLAWVGLVACSKDPGPAPAPNVLLLTIDTLRADHTSAYGYGRDTTPRLSALASRGALFERAYSQAPFTAPSHASLFTGLVTQSHGVLHWSSQLSEEVPTLAELFSAEGYATGAFFNHPSLPATGLLRGFEKSVRRVLEPYEVALADCFAWIDEDHKGQAGQRPFAIWLHYWDVHRPYGFRDWSDPLYQKESGRQAGQLRLAFAERGFGPDYDPRIGRIEAHYNLSAAERAGPLPVPGEAARPFEPADYEAIVNRYDNGVHFADQGLGELLDGLERRGLSDNTVLCVTSDHGESLTERQGCWFTHDPYLYEETLHVPLVWSLPGGRYAGRRSDVLARGIDVLPTLLDAAGMQAPELQGRSLLNVLDGSDRRSLPLFAQTQTKDAKERSMRLTPDQPGWLEYRQALFDGRYKLIHDLEQERAELFDLQKDPGERLNLLAMNPPPESEIGQLRVRLEGELAKAKFEARPAPGTERSMSREEVEVLVSLGYLPAEALEAFGPKSPGNPPTEGGR